MDRQNFCKALKEIADNHWLANQMPILLSTLPKLLREKIGAEEYQKILGTNHIKSLVKSSGKEFGYQLIEHPTQKAKIGVAPLSAVYKFKVEGDAKNIDPKDGQEFVRILAKLSEEELHGISIPASVIVKLFGEK